MKKYRHEAIIKLIESEAIATQEELTVRLSELGYEVTQATVSRDIKNLGLVKTPDEKGYYRYTLPKTGNKTAIDKYLSVFAHSVSSIDYAGNIVAVKCFSGMASAAAASIDKMNYPQVVATLAGDDTIFVLCRTNESAEEFKTTISTYLS